MADSSSNKSGLNALTSENWSKIVQSTLFDAMPEMQIFFSRFGSKQSPTVGLGIPDSSFLLTGVKGTKVRKKEVFARSYQPLLHTSKPAEADGKAMAYRDNMPTRTDWKNNSPSARFQRPTVKWCEISDPLEVPNSDLRDTKRANAQERNGWEAIGDLMRVERDDVLGVHTKRWSQLLWGTYTGGLCSTTGYPSDEDADNWNAIHSFTAVAGTTGFLYGVDRDLSTGAHMKGNTINAAAPVFRDMIRYAKHEMPITNTDLTTSTGLFSKNADLPVILTGGPLFNIALAEAEGMKGAQVIPGGEKIPGIAEFGFSRECVRIDNTYIIPCPGAPAGQAVGLNLDAWTVAIHPDGNFYQSPPFNQNQLKGGDDSHAWFLRSRLLVCCEVPPIGIINWTALA